MRSSQRKLLLLLAQPDARVDEMPLAPVARSSLADRLAGGPQVAAKVGFGGFRVFADLAPIFVSGIEIVHGDLLLAAKLAPLAHESTDRRREVLHSRNRLIGSLEASSASGRTRCACRPAR